MEKSINSKNKRNSGNSKFSKFAPFLAGVLLFMNPSGVEAQNITSSNKNSVEVSTTTILDRLGNKVGASLPSEYAGKLRDFVTNNPVMKTRSASEFTENFIIEQMQNERGIKKDYQYAFMRFAICEGITEETLYDRLDDNNEDRANAYEKVLTQINKFYEEYEKGFEIFMGKQSAEARQQSAEARQQSAESLTSSLENLARFYNRYKKDPSTIKDEEVLRWKSDGKKVIQRCKELGIDYKAKLSPEMLKFYGVE